MSEARTSLVVAVSFSRQGEWSVAEINLKKQKMILHGAKGYTFGDVEKYNKKCMFLPLLHLLPRILKAIWYYSAHRIRRPKYAQFGFTFEALKGREAFQETHAADATLFCMKQVKWIISNVELPIGLENAKKGLEIPSSCRKNHLCSQHELQPWGGHYNPIRSWGKQVMVFEKICFCK